MLKLFRPVLSIAVLSNFALADCIELTSGKIEVKVKSCEAIDSKKLIDTSGPKEDVLEPAQREGLRVSYDGLLIKGRVVKSSATAVGQNTRRHALLGQDQTFFLAQKTGEECEKFRHKVIRSKVTQTCCDGHYQTPCLTGTSYSLTILK